MKEPIAALLLTTMVGLLLVLGCGGPEENSGPSQEGQNASQAEEVVVLYTSLDQIYSEPIVQKFEAKTGIEVKCVYDTEAVKTVGLVNRLIAEAPNPICDVFWNNEIARTVILKKRGLLQPYYSPSATDIPGSFKDKDGYWTGFAARARVIGYNTNLMSRDEVPKSIYNLAKPQWKGKFGMANPLFGTTSTHFAALFALLGEEKAKELFQSIKNNEVVMLPGNSTVRDRVRDGKLLIGMTDTDDVNMSMLKGKPIDFILLDSHVESPLGAMVIPNTVAMIKSCPHPDAARKLIDCILSPEVEAHLARCPSAQIPVRASVQRPSQVPDLSKAKLMDIDYEKVADEIEVSSRYLRDVFLQ